MLTRREQAWLRLHLINGLGRRGLFRLLELFDSPEEALQAGPENWPRRIGALRTEAIRVPAVNGAEYAAARAALARSGARIISFWDDDYPEILRTIHDPPALLYVRGRLDPEPALAVIGSRRCSNAGERITREICREIAGAGITIISGMARGIDSAAHEGALDVSGRTIAVLGCGIDRIYPPENARIYQRISEQGAVISEYLPGTEPLAGHFPGRNRIISGLSRGVLIVEAAAGSGSLITAEFALEQGRDVFAIPGAISSSNSRGVNNLLKEGAHLVTEAQDIINLFRPGFRPVPTASENIASRLEGLSEKELRLIECIGDEPLQADDLVRKSGLTPMELSAILLQLELRGTVTQLPGMRYVRSL